MLTNDKRLFGINIAFLTLGVAIGSHFRPMVPPPAENERDIRVVFDSLARAEEMRRSGDLKVEDISGACTEAAKNYIRYGRIGAAGSVGIVLPTREDLEAVRRFPLDKSLENTPN